MLQPWFGPIDKCRKIVIGRGPSDVGPRLGGRPPAGLSPRWPLKYLLTVPWVGTQELSVFVDTDPDFIYGDETALPVGAPHFDVQLHSPCRRGGPGPNDSELSEHPLLIGLEVDDIGPVDEDGVQQPYSGHKLGGLPFVVHGDVALKKAIEELLEDGFSHALQIEFPGEPEAAVAGPWPFGTGPFHVLVRERAGQMDYRCYWEL